MESSQAAGRRLATRANLLTAVRLLSAPLLAAAIIHEHAPLAAALFGLAVVTDLLDGRVARRFGESSALGGLFDHATDATTAACGLAALALRGAVPAVLPLLVVAAFLQYTLDSRALRGRALRASSLGRWNGIAYFVLLGVPLVRDVLGLSAPPDGVVLGLGWLLVVSTLVSMADRAFSPARRR